MEAVESSVVTRGLGQGRSEWAEQRILRAMKLLCVCVCAHSQSRPILCNTRDYNVPGSSALGIFQARILEWVAISYSIQCYSGIQVIIYLSKLREYTPSRVNPGVGPWIVISVSLQCGVLILPEDVLMCGVRDVYKKLLIFVQFFS